MRSDPLVVSVLAAGLLAATVLLVVPIPPSAAGLRRRPALERTEPPGRSGWVGAPVLLLAAAAAGAASLAVSGPALLLAVVTIGAGWGVLDLARRRRRREVAATAALRATEFCEALAADLLVGGAPAQALAAAVVDYGEFEPVCAAERLGADVPEALRHLAERPGLGDLRLVAGAWHVSHRSGAGLADSLDRVARTLRARRRTGRLVGAELASAYATARIMAALPLIFLLVGSGLGGDPLGFLLGGTPGALCLASGLFLTWAGLAWLHRIGAGVVAT